ERSGDDGQAGKLSEGHDALLQDITGTARAIGSDRNIIAVLSRVGKFKEGLRAPPTGGATDGFNFETAKDRAQKSAIFAGADQGSHFGRGVSRLDVPLVNHSAQTKAIMPETAHCRVNWKNVDMT